MQSWLAVAQFAAIAALPAGAQTPLPVGAQFQINTFTTGYQINPFVTVSEEGGFVTVWSSYGSFGTDTSNFSVQSRRYASDGSPLGDETQVNTYTTSFQSAASVALSDDGGFVVGWASDGSTETDQSFQSTQARRHDSDGIPVGGEFQVNTYTTGVQGGASVSVGNDGGFVAIWRSFGSPGTDTVNGSIQARRYDSGGSAQGAQFQVNTFTAFSQEKPSVVKFADGDFVVVWQSPGSFGTDHDSWSIQARRYASDGSAQGGEFQVNTFTTYVQSDAAVAASPDGGFVVVWRSTGSYGTDTSDSSIQGQRYASDGSPLGGEFQVNDHTPDHQIAPAVAMLPDGDFVVVWVSPDSPGSNARSIRGQLFTSDGLSLGREFQVNSYVTAYQSKPNVQAAANGDFVVVWESLGSPGNDLDWSVQARRFTTSAPEVPTLAPGAAAAAVLLMLCAAALALRRAV